MAAENLPSEFDVVILGTGLAESIVAAACSRVGQRVLHLDRRSYYAGHWASFTFNSLLTWIQEYNNAGHIEETVHDWSSLLEEGEETICLSSTDSAISNLQVFCYASEEEEAEEEEATKTPGASNTTEEESGGGGGGDDGCTTETTDAGTGNAQEPSETPEKQTTETPEEQTTETPEDQTTETPEQVVETEQEGPKGSQSLPSPSESQPEPVRKKITYARLLKEGRRFNIDLVSKLMYSRGPLVDLLIKSNVSRYAEFKNLTRILTYRDGRVEQVPCSRADVFGSKQLSVVEKRMLMKFLTFCLDYQDQPQEYQAFAERPFAEYLRTQKLTDNLQHFLLHSIAMVKEDTPTEEGLSSTRHFLRCLGRYGNTPFLFPLYGLGEIPQCFCRMSAVFGGIYCLRHSIQGLVIDKDNKCKAVIDSRGLRISCSHFVVEDGHVGDRQKTRATPTRSISRAVLITDGSVLPSESEQQVSLVSVPPVEPGGPVVRLVELCSSTQTCIPGTYLVHLTCQSVGSAYQDLLPVVTRLFQTPETQDQEGRPSVLWCMYFNMADSSAVEAASYDLPSNVHVCSGPDASLGHQHPIALAESIFQKILPEEEFCPPAPNPEDIIYDGDNSSSSPGQEEVERQGEGEREEQKEGEEEDRERENVGEEEKDGEEKEGGEEREKEKEGGEEREQEKAGDEEKEGEEREDEKEGGEEKGREEEQGEEIQEEPPVEE